MIHQLRQVADRQRTRLWQVICRLDLAQFPVNDEALARATELATTPALVELVDHYNRPVLIRSQEQAPTA